MKRGDYISLLFTERPEGTHYTKGAWSWVHEDEAKGYLEDGLAEEFKPNPPDASNTKQEIKDYLEEQGIEYESDMLKDELLELL